MIKNLLLTIGVAALLVGCNAGMAEKGDDNAAKEALKKMNLQQKIDWINRSPIPPEEKQRQIDQAKKEAGQDGVAGTAQGFGGKAGAPDASNQGGANR